MLITETGLYEMLEDRQVRFNSYSVGTLPKGLQFKVTQIDDKNNKFYAEVLGDWQYYVFPCKKVD